MTGSIFRFFYLGNDIIFFKEHIIQYKMMHKDRKLSYGILIKDSLHYRDLKEVIKHHHLVLQVRKQKIKFYSLSYYFSNYFRQKIKLIGS